MNKRSLNILEYNKILAILSEYANSEMAKKRCLRIQPQKELNLIERLQEETRDAFLRLERQGNLNFSGLRDVRAEIKRLEVESALSAKELLDIAALLETARAVKKYGEGDGDGGEGSDSHPGADSLTERFSMLVPLEDVSSEIRRCIIAADEIADDASSTLKNIRKKIAQAGERLHRELDKIIKSDTYRDMLQDSLITQRGGRYCVPVKQAYRSKFPGMLHDQSQSGSTLFIEPMAVVNLNNEIKELQNDETTEIEAILESLSARCAAVHEDISFDLTTLTDLDFIFAKAKYARDIRAVQPKFNTEHRVDIRQGRHPLLDKKTVVPVDIRLGGDYNLLIVTGPNTGGKTVSLKTLGLFSLMGQAGLHIPADEGSSLALLSDVFADIGDEQSIEMSLSTFSSHMSNIVYIIKHADENCLCLFDELGGGTDPAEGAGLATALLDHLRQLGALVMATTHYDELKTYAMQTPGAMNASCEFDIETLAPTYRFRIGVPGSSNAFAIAGKLGLPDYIIEDARRRLDSGKLDMEKLITDLSESKKQAEEDARRAKEQREEIEALKASLSAKEKELSEKKAEILDKAREEARDLLDEAKQTADAAISDYNKWRSNPNRADARTMEDRRGKLRDQIGKLDKDRTKAKPARTSNHKASDFHIGDTVLVLSMNTKGTISALPDSKGIAGVRMGIINTKLPIKDLAIIDEPTVKAEGQAIRTTGKSITGKAMTISPELNVIGLTVDEAIAKLDKYLDDAVLAHMSSVRIVHGKGTGALRKGIQEHLRFHPSVSRYRSGEYGEGEHGVTVVEL